MPTPRQHEEVSRETIRRVEEELRAGARPEGMSGNGKAAIRLAGERAVSDGFVNCTNAFQSRLERARGRGFEPDWSLYQMPRYQQPVPKLHLLPAPAAPIREHEGQPRRVLVIPDRHNDPRHPHRLDCSTWIFRYGSEHRHDTVVCLGDDVTFDSCSRHDRNETMKGRLKPGIRADLDNHLAVLQAEERGRDKDWKPRKKKTRGNHNNRLWLFENEHPESYGTHTLEYEQNLLQFGWDERPYGEVLYIENVGFSHAPLRLGREIGGVTGPQRASNTRCRSLIHGHSHTFHWYDAPKDDPQDKITICSAGCALPEGEVEHYATHGGATGWRYGVLDLLIQNGDIVNFQWVSMRSLRDRYSDDGADVAA